VSYPLRGQVWDIDFAAGTGMHTGVIISTNSLNARLGHVIAALITGTPGPSETHLPLGPEAGLARYEQSYLNITDLHAVDRYDVLRPRGLLAPSEMHVVAERLRTYLGL
jgi:mRNA interferase MazF